VAHDRDALVPGILYDFGFDWEVEANDITYKCNA
jgi:hypothetical protein